jgi:hypothetical protein
MIPPLLCRKTCRPSETHPIGNAGRRVGFARFHGTHAAGCATMRRLAHEGLELHACGVMAPDVHIRV